MIELPIFNSDIIVIAGVIHIKWYGFMYVLGFATAWLIAKSRLENSGFDQETLLDLRVPCQEDLLQVLLLVIGRLICLMICLQEN